MIYIPLLVCIVGLVIYAATDHAKITTIAEYMFWTGLLVTLAALR